MAGPVRRPVPVIVTRHVPAWPCPVLSSRRRDAHERSGFAMSDDEEIFVRYEEGVPVPEVPEGAFLRFHCEACTYTLLLRPGVDDPTSGPVVCRTCVPYRIVEPPPRIFRDRKPDLRDTLPCRNRHAARGGILGSASHLPALRRHGQLRVEPHRAGARLFSSLDLISQPSPHGSSLSRRDLSRAPRFRPIRQYRAGRRFFHYP